MSAPLKLEQQPSTLVAIQRIMADGGWWTLWKLQYQMGRRFAMHCGETAISARLRTLRKLGWTVERRPSHSRANSRSRACDYRLKPGDPQ